MSEEKEQKTGKTPAQIEEDILNYWDENKIFQKTLDKTRNNKPYVFYDGPPFATGLPHYGHILSSTIKDAVPRYWTMRGYYVSRRWGWDCHGLPIEQLVEQDLGISGKKQIEELGVDKFNETCRVNVLRYVEEWGKTVRRIGRFVDFENSYKTMDSTFMESVWWAVKQIWDKGLVYEGRKVLLYCPRCETPLSNFEVAMDNSYDDVTEESVYVRFKVSGGDADTYILAWTTTPWTLPANLALAVGKDIDYVLVRPSEDDKQAGIRDGQYIIAKARVEIVFNNPQILKEFKGSEIAGMKYEPLFDVPELRSDKSWKVYDADFVTTEDGTGIVHTAVVYGEEDYELGLKVGLPVVPLITQQGLFNELSPDFLRGKFYKDTEPEIIAKIKENGALFKSEAFTHSVAFCWRCGTRLFYNAIPAWFVNIQKIKPRLLELNNDQINWYPDHLKHGRFEKGLENAPDWNISRNRYWATPLPFWKCQNKSCGRTACVGSLDELRDKAVNYDEVYSSDKITEIDLHRPQIDKIRLRCGVCNDEMHRVPEVIDCWVESASMPFASSHYPFENREETLQRMPAQFVAEYINQTRAWFYVMHVVSAILWDKAPFEHVVNTGVILAEDGSKMSKSKKNYPDPWYVINKYGVDALRYYMLASPVMQAENLFFSEKELDEVYKKMILMLGNVHSFYKMYSSGKVIDGQRPLAENVLDLWMLARLHQLQISITTAMNNYDTVRATRPILEFVSDLSTWYVRRSRDRFKEGDDQAKKAMHVFGFILVELSKLMAPFMPFISEHIYRDLTGNESVHLADWSKDGEQEMTDIEKDLIAEMQSTREMVELGLSARKEANIKVRQPLEYFVYRFKNQDKLPLDLNLHQVLAEELNVKEVNVVPEIGDMPDTIRRENADAEVLLSVKLTPELKVEGYARELERQVQDLRKKSGLNVGELVNLYYNTSDPDLEAALVEKFDRKKTFVVQVRKELEVEPDYEVQTDIDSKTIWLGIVKV
ncbi:isoleucine--tRNA ligase [Patescibacteria group bacterium]|nr:isoleucine--tRNA ligase [Patescibacteria group bacterium]